MRVPVAALASLLSIAATSPTALAQSAQAQGNALAQAENAFSRVDFDGTRTAARAALEAGGHSPVEIARIWYLIALSSAALRDNVAARDAFIHVIALVPHQDLLPNLSPAMRGPYLEARSWWATQAGTLGVTVARGEQELRVHVTDPAHMARAVSARVRVGGGTYVPVRLPLAPTIEIPVAGLSGSQPVDYALRVVDEWGNRLMEFGTESSPRTLAALPSPMRPALGVASYVLDPSWRPWGIGGLAAGAVTIAFAGYADSLRQTHASNWNSTACLANGLTRQENCGSEYNAAISAQSWAIAGFAIGGALLVGGGALLILSEVQSSGTGDTTHRASFGCGPAWLGAVCEGRF